MKKILTLLFYCSVLFAAEPVRHSEQFVLSSIFNNTTKSIRILDGIFSLATGTIPGAKMITKLGRNIAVGTTAEDMWAAGGIRNWFTAAETLDIVSDSALDTALGTGARSVIIEGLNPSFVEITETVATAGLGTAVTTNTFIRVNRVVVGTTGTYGNTGSGSNEGAITISGTGTGFLQATITKNGFGRGQAQFSHYTVPVGMQAVMTQVIANTAATKIISYSLLIRPNADNIVPPVSPILSLYDASSLEGFITVNLTAPIVLDEKTDIWIIGTASSGAGNESEAGYGLIVFDKALGL